MRAILPPDALSGLPHAVAAGVEALRVRLGDSLLAKGKRILEKMPREAMLRRRVAQCCSQSQLRDANGVTWAPQRHPPVLGCVSRAAITQVARV
jgi:hypothetical protein